MTRASMLTPSSLDQIDIPPQSISVKVNTALGLLPYDKAFQKKALFPPALFKDVVFRRTSGSLITASLEPACSICYVCFYMLVVI